MLEHRADVPDYDWDVNDFPGAGIWTDLDLTGIIPEHTHAVLFRCVLRSTTVDKYFALRRKGYTQGKIASYTDVSVANLYERDDMIVGIDSDRIIQGFKSHANISAIFLVVKGWWF